MPTNGSCRITACLILRQKHGGKNNKEPKPREHHEVETTSNQKHICVVPALAGDTDTMRSLYSPSAPLIPNYKLRFSTTAAAKKRPHSSYGFPIVSTTLNPNSPGCTEVRSTLVMLISDSPFFWFFFAQIIKAGGAQRGRWRTRFLSTRRDFCEARVWNEAWDNWKLSCFEVARWDHNRLLRRLLLDGWAPGHTWRDQEGREGDWQDNIIKKLTEAITLLRV